MPSPRLPDALGLFTDLYELTMAQAYHDEGMSETAVFDLHVRTLPHAWNHFVACGLESALDAITRYRFTREDVEYLATLGLFTDAFLDVLRDFRFTGSVHAIPEGTPVFPYESILQVEAPIMEAQLLETVLLNQVHVQTLLASKAARAVEAARGRRVIDFGLRRAHGYDAGVKAARAFHVAGVTATSNVLAGRAYGIPVRGTMAHSYVQAHDDEHAAFRAFARSYPATILLVDTYDTAEGVREVVRLAEELGDDFEVEGIRLDSGDLAALARDARRVLDAAGLTHVKVYASGGLDEYEIAQVLDADAPIDGFGVGTGMSVSADQPYLDAVYKLAEYAGEPRFKTSTNKVSLPGRKQVYRETGNGRHVRDTLALAGEAGIAGTPLVHPVMENGRPRSLPALEEIRAHALAERERLPEPIRGLRAAAKPYPVIVSDGIRALMGDAAPAQRLH